MHKLGRHRTARLTDAELMSQTDSLLDELFILKNSLSQLKKLKWWKLSGLEREERKDRIRSLERDITWHSDVIEKNLQTLKRRIAKLSLDEKLSTL